MTTATLMKRIATKHKDITRYQKEMDKEVEFGKAHPEFSEETWGWVKHYTKLINARLDEIAEMRKTIAKLATEEEKQELIDSMVQEMIEHGIRYKGVTSKGLHYEIFANSGWTKRSDKCFSMTIEGIGTAFTSGTLETVATYIINN